jgi:hypothetical protein
MTFLQCSALSVCREILLSLLLRGGGRGKEGSTRNFDRLGSSYYYHPLDEELPSDEELDDTRVAAKVFLSSL